MYALVDFQDIMPFYWNYLCQAIKESVYEFKFRRFNDLKCLISKILYRHDQLVDEKS